MGILKTKAESTKVAIKAKIESSLAERIESVVSKAKAIGAEFPTDEVIEKALEKAVKQAEKELADSAPES